MKRRYLMVTMCALIAFIMCFSASASLEQYVFESENVTIIFDEDTNLDLQSREMVARYLVHGELQETTYGLKCTLFGHSYETSAATKITHCVRDTNPRCLREIYEVQVCKDCEHTITEILGSSYITCCPEE